MFFHGSCLGSRFQSPALGSMASPDNGLLPGSMSQTNLCPSKLIMMLITNGKQSRADHSNLYANRRSGYAVEERPGCSSPGNCPSFTIASLLPFPIPRPQHHALDPGVLQNYTGIKVIKLKSGDAAHLWPPAEPSCLHAFIFFVTGQTGALASPCGMSEQYVKN